jgi:DNA-binding Lrp family transcriptional regulator
MGQITNEKQLQCFYKIYEQVYLDNVMSINEIAQNVNMSRNTVTKYLKIMYEKDMLRGPYLRVNPAQNYAEYIYLMQFANPGVTFQRFTGFPHVVYCAQLFGDWNTIVITDELLDLSQLVGFQKMVFNEVRGVSYTPKVNLIPWEQSAYCVEDYLRSFEPELTPTQRNVLPELPWGNKEWTLFSAFHSNIRRKITPALREIEVRYEEYREWKKDIDIYCTRHTGFYPQGYQQYGHHCFLVSTEYEPQVKKVFSFFPTTSFFMEVGTYMMVVVSVPNPDITRWLYLMVQTMKSKKIIKKFWHAHVLFHKNLRSEPTKDG